MVASGLYGFALAPVDATALPAAPGKFRKVQHFLLERMVNRDGQGAIAVHLSHLAQKVRSMIRSPFEDIVLPLMDHFMGEGAGQFIQSIGCASQQGLEERERQADFTLKGFLLDTSGP